ncbi:MAG: ArsR family transcriptional regulator [Candidatus Goldiibacteriota bacterium HGW-Goldbacteria-1]|jgi:ArsR family transcriptional regulator|nr:MAG: ArsR family transcriptional regulator [Candidatus Goldiibacteriota bacterium HGW-Goldbacteria-1]
MERALEVFAALSDKTRLRTYRLLLKAGKDIAVCELIDALSESQYNVSKHLQILKTAGMVKETRKGRWVLYSVIESPEVELAEPVLKMQEEIFKTDMERLKKRLSLRNGDDIVSCQLARQLMEA